MSAIDTREWRHTRPLINAAASVILILGLGALLVVGKDVLVPFTLAMLLSFALSPVVRFLQHIGMPRAIAVVTALLLVVAAVGLWFWFLSGQIADLGAQLPAYRSTIHDKLHALSERFKGAGDLPRVFDMVEDAVRELAPAAQNNADAPAPQHVVVVDDLPFSRIGTLGGYASPLLSPVGLFALVLIFTGFLLSQREDLRNRLIKLIGPKDIYRTTEAIDDAGRRVGRMLLAQVALNAIFGLIVGLGLWAFHVPNPPLWGAVAAIARFVPYIGVAIGLIPPLLVAFAFDPSWTSFLETLALFMVAEPVLGYIVEPILYGQSSGLSPVAVVIAASVWAFLWGPVGLVLATPLTICLIVIGRHVPRLAFIDTMLGDSPPLEPHEMFYQRMLAGDPREAFSQARGFLKARKLANYYDEIALEALRRAQDDVVSGRLDEHRLETMTASLQRLVGWLSARKPRRPRGELAAATSDERGSVAVLHGVRPFDVIAGAMLAQELNRHGITAELVSLVEAEGAPPEAKQGVELVCLCILEPTEPAQLRATVRAVRHRAHPAKVMLCLWRDDIQEPSETLADHLAIDSVATSLTSAVAGALRFFRRDAPAVASRPELAPRLPATQG